MRLDKRQLRGLIKEAIVSEASLRHSPDVLAQHELFEYADRRYHLLGKGLINDITDILVDKVNMTGVFQTKLTPAEVWEFIRETEEHIDINETLELAMQEAIMNTAKIIGDIIEHMLHAPGEGGK